MYQIKSLIFTCFILLAHKLSKVDCGKFRNDDLLLQPFYLGNYLNYEKGLIYKSIKQLQDSVALVNNNLFNNHNLNHFYGNGIFNRRLDLKSLSDLKPTVSSDYKPFDQLKPIFKYYKPLFKKGDKLQLIQQLNKEIVKNQLVAYEKFLSQLTDQLGGSHAGSISKFLNRLQRYDSDPMESRQAVNLIKTLFRFPVLLLFSNIFNLPLLPTLILASPFLNNKDPSSMATTLSSNPAGSAAAAAGSSAAASTLFNAVASPMLQASSSNQISSTLPFSLNPLVPINQLLNNFVGELVQELQNTPVFNSFIQGVNQVLVKPNRVSPLQNQQQQQFSIQNAQNITKKLIGEAAALNSALNATADELINANASSINLIYQEPPAQSSPLPNTPLIGPVPSDPSQAGSSILNTLASSLLETNKNYQLTEQLGVNNGGSITELAMNAVNTLATMLKIKKQKKDLNSNEEMLLDMLTSKNYLQEITSIGNLLKYGLKQKMEKEMNICLVRTVCESNQKQIAFAFDQLFSLAMHLTGMESRIEQSPWHEYYRVGRKMINEKNICKLIPKIGCDDDDDDNDKSLTKMKLNILEKIEDAKKINKLLSRKESMPDYQKPFRLMKKARKIRFAKRLFNKSFRKFDKLSRRMSRMIF